MSKKNNVLSSELENYILKIRWMNIIIDGEMTDYEVSDNGFVLSRKNKSIRILSSSLTEDGYSIVKLYVGDKKYTRRIHRLVAEAFIPNPDNKPEVNHKNGKKTDNEVSNLEWVTPSENVKHAFSTGLNKGKIGIYNGATVFTDDQVHKVCELLEKGKEAKEISKILKIPKYLADNIKNKLSWLHISKDYDIPDTKIYDYRPKGTRSKVIDFMKNGVFDYSKILLWLELPDTLANRTYLSNIKSEIKRLKDEGSTTIDQLR